MNTEEVNPTSFCIVCDKPFQQGDFLQAFLRCPEEPLGSWTTPALVDKLYQTRAAKNKDNIKRKHRDCPLTK